ncbi:MAG: NAD-dependent epimerase/dehydratase family protein, partial [Verrucomicrobiaceae bacterium]
MKVAVTGADGFVGRHVVDALQRRGDEVITISRSTKVDDFRHAVLQADAIVHLAGANRPKEEREFSEVNRDLAVQMVEWLMSTDRRPPIVFSSSTQAEIDNAYGRSKREGEEVLEDYVDDHGGRATIFRFPNIFGKGSKPFYNTVVATFCHNVARGQTNQVSDPELEITFVY